MKTARIRCKKRSVGSPARLVARYCGQTALITPVVEILGKLSPKGRIFFWKTRCFRVIHRIYFTADPSILDNPKEHA